MTSESTPTTLQPGSFSLATQLLAFFAGIAGGLAFVQLHNGGIGWVLLAYMSPLPLFLSGLTGGRAAAVTACFFALVAVFLRASIDTTIFFVAVIAVPTMVLTRIALINHPDAAGSPRYISGGTILLAALTLGTILTAAAAILLDLYGPGVAAAVSQALDIYQSATIETNPDLPAEQLKQSLLIIKPMVPALILMSWFVIIAFNGTLAQWLSSEMKLNVRPTPMLKNLDLPRWTVIVFAICVVGSWFVPADTHMILVALATIYGTGFVLTGLGAMHRWIDARAVTHSWTDGKKLGCYILVYALIFIVQLPMIFLLVWGLIAPFTSSRHHQRTVTPDSGNDLTGVESKE